MTSLQTNKRLEALAVFFQIMVFLNRRRPVSVSPSAKFFHSDTLIVAPFAVSETNTIRLPLNDANSGEAAPDIFVFPVIKAAETYKNNIHHLCGSEVVCVCVCVCVRKENETQRFEETCRSGQVAEGMLIHHLPESLCIGAATDVDDHVGALVKEACHIRRGKGVEKNMRNIQKKNAYKHLHRHERDKTSR